MSTADKAIIQSNKSNGHAPNLFAGVNGGEWWRVERPGFLVLTGNMPQDEWLKLAEKAIGDFETSRDNHLASMFMVGDVLSYGEREYGETYSQAIDATRRSIRLSAKTLENAAWICGSVKPETRHLALTFSHHEAVAKLTSAEEQKEFLDLAEENEWTVSELRKAIKAKYPPQRRGPGAGSKVVVNLETDEGILHALEKGLEWLINETPDDWTKERGAAYFPTIARWFAFFAVAEEPAREAAKEIAAYLDNPDNGPLVAWKDGRKKKWATQLNAISKAARRMGVTACGNPKKKDGDKEAPEAAEE